MTCPLPRFCRFFEITPDDLIRDGLYKKMAVALHTGRHYMVSLAMLGKSLGAVQRGKWGRYLSKVSTNASRAGNLSSTRISSQRISVKNEDQHCFKTLFKTESHESVLGAVAAVSHTSPECAAAGSESPADDAA